MRPQDVLVHIFADTVENNSAVVIFPRLVQWEKPGSVGSQRNEEHKQKHDNSILRSNDL
jgi:hypothetical protein